MFEIVNNADARGSKLLIRVPIAKGSVFHRFVDCPIQRNPNRLTIQVSSSEHLTCTDVLVYLNHSCCPNVFVDASDLSVIALSDIETGEELCIFYPATEWDMHTPFECQCGHADCIGTVAGAKHLPQKIRARYVLNRHILELTRETESALS